MPAPKKKATSTAKKKATSTAKKKAAPKKSVAKKSATNKSVAKKPSKPTKVPAKPSKPKAQPKVQPKAVKQVVMNYRIIAVLAIILSVMVMYGGYRMIPWIEDRMNVFPPEIYAHSPVWEEGWQGSYRRVPTDKKMVALTFTGGPYSPYTEAILNVLDKYQVKATFFMLGENIAHHPDAARSVYNRGHEIGNMTFTHPRLSEISDPEVIKKEIVSTYRLLQDVVYLRERIEEMAFRAPYLEDYPELQEILKEIGVVPIGANITTKDWDESQSVNRITARAVKPATPGSIIAMHDGPHGDKTNSVEATEKIIKQLQAEGYEIVPVRVLLENMTDEAIKRVQTEVAPLSLY